MTSTFKINKERTNNDLTDISATIFPMLRRLLGPKNFLQLELLRHWREIVGKEMAQYSLPHKISFAKNAKDKGTLAVMVPSGAFAMEIKQNENMIIQEINLFLGYKAIEKLNIIQNAMPELFEINKKSVHRVKKKLVSKAEQNYITELTEDITRPELRDVLVNLGMAVLGDEDNI